MRVLVVIALQGTCCDMPIPPLCFFFIVYYVYFNSHWFLGKGKKNTFEACLQSKFHCAANIFF